MKIYFLMVLTMLVVPAFSQSGDTVFTVKAKVSTIRLTPDVNILYKDFTKIFTLIKPAGCIIDTVVFLQGKVEVKDSFIYLKPSKTGTVLLKIYEKLAGGKKALAFMKQYEVQKFTEPQPNLDGVACDSAGHRLMLSEMGYISVPVHPEPALKRISYNILSFEVYYSNNGTIDTARTNGNRLSYDMRDRIDKMGEGSIIDIGNIKYLVDGDTLLLTKPLRVYIRNDTINKF